MIIVNGLNIDGPLAVTLNENKRLNVHEHDHLHVEIIVKIHCKDSLIFLLESRLYI